MKQERDNVWYSSKIKRLKASPLAALDYSLGSFWAKLALESEFELLVRLN